MRVFFFGTPDYAVPSLEGLIDAGHEIVGVLCQQDKPVGRKRIITPPPVKVFAETRGIPVLQPERVADANDEISALRPDIFVVVAFGKLIPQSTLDLSPLPPINGHASLLPKFRGAAPAERSIMAGDTETGVSVMQVVKELDAGPVLLTKRICIGPDMNRLDVLEELSKLTPVALNEGLEILATGTYEFIEQDHSAYTYAPKILREDGALDWSQSARTVYNQFRGVTPFPGAYGYLTIAGKGEQVMVKFEKATLGAGTGGSMTPGKIIVCTSHGIEVACGDGSIVLTEVKPQGKRSMAPNDFVNGYRVVAGDYFTQE